MSNSLCVCLVFRVSTCMWFASCWDPGGSLTADNKDTSVSAEHFPRPAGAPLERDERRPTQTKQGTSLASNPSTETNQQNPQIWNQSPELMLWTHLRGSDQCKEDEGNPTFYIRERGSGDGGERRGHPAIMMYFRNLHNILADPHTWRWGMKATGSRRAQENVMSLPAKCLCRTFFFSSFFFFGGLAGGLDNAQTMLPLSPREIFSN